MATTVNWTKTGNYGITPRGYSIVRSERDGAEVWNVFNAFEQHLGTYSTREQAARAAR
jgi:hypothetical protein